MSSRTDKTKHKGASSPRPQPAHTDLLDISPTGSSTPLKSSLAEILPPEHTRAVVDPQLKEDIEPNMQGPLDVKLFVKSVLGFDASRLRWGQWEFTPPTPLHERYRASNNEPGLYQPFCDMLDDAFSQWSLCAPVKTSQNQTIHFKPTTGRIIPGHSGVTRANRRNPDIRGEALQGPIGSKWATIPFVGEFVKTSNLEDEEPNTTGDPEPSCSTASAPSVGDTGAGTSRKRRLSILDEANKARKTNPRSFPSIDVKDPSVGGAESATAPSPPPRRKALRLTSHQVQLAGYANEVFKAVGNRRYVTGIFVNDDKMSLWYYDRIGVVRSRDFNMFKDLELFVLFAVAVSVCDRKHVGYEPLLKPGPAAGTNDIVLSTVDNNTLCLDSRHVVDGSGAPVHYDVSFQIIGMPIYVQYGIVGRGTVVYAIAPNDGGLASGVGELVAKLSWPVKTLAAEDALIRDIRSKIDPAWSKHLPKILFSMTLDGEALDLPRKLMGSLDGQAEDRFLRILVAHRAQGLEQARSLEEFKAIFLQAVRCHRVVFVKTNILHRDLSVDNLLFTRDGDNALVLVNDWDPAKESKPDDERPTARRRTGTAHFMALDLLKKDKDPPRHLYRHDLESFIYILIWCAVHFDLMGNRKSPHPLLKPWTEGTWEDIHDRKVKRFSGLVNIDSLIGAVQPVFEPLVQKWILPLCNLLMEVQSQILERENNYIRLKWNMISETESMPHQAEQDAWNETQGGLMTFENFMKTIGEDPVIPELAAIPQ